MSRFFEDVTVGEELPVLALPINVYRMVMSAGATRDFNAIHHNSEHAQATGADEIYANTGFLMGMWERCVRDWMGEAGVFRSIKGFAMKSFNYVGDTTRVIATVTGADIVDGQGIVTITVRSENSRGLTVGPGTVTVALPLRDAPVDL